MVVSQNKCRLVAATFKLRTYSTQALSLKTTDYEEV